MPSSTGKQKAQRSVKNTIRTIGRRSRALNGDAVALSRRLADSSDASARWLVKDALRELTSPMVQRKLVPKRA
jgi:3-methyladenine DNA glycosylase AlkD